MSDDGINHGTYGGYQAHRKRGEDACDVCIDANNAYTRDYRKRAEVKGQEARLDAARRRAWRRLAAMHPTEYSALYDEERRRAEAAR